MSKPVTDKTFPYVKGGWPTFAIAPPWLPHPSRFSKGEHHGRWHQRVPPCRAHPLCESCSIGLKGAVGGNLGPSQERAVSTVRRPLLKREKWRTPFFWFDK